MTGVQTCALPICFPVTIRTMMMQSSIDIEAFIRNDFASIIALAIDTAATSYWIGEGNDLTQSEGTFKRIPLRMKTVGASSRYTRTMMMQSSIDIEAFIRNDFASIIALAIDTAARNRSFLSVNPSSS